MPAELKLIDVTQEISEHIMLIKSQSQHKQNFLERLLFPLSSEIPRKELFSLYSIPHMNYNFIALFESISFGSSDSKLKLVKDDFMRVITNAFKNDASTIIIAEHLKA